MMKFSLFITSLALFSFASFSFADTRPVETLVKNLSAPRSQGLTGFCYGFAANELVQQFYCKTNGSNCQDPKEILSVLDVIRGGESKPGVITSGGASYKVLNNLKNGATVATEECASFAKTYLDGHQPSKAYSGGTLETDQANYIWMDHNWSKTSEQDINQAALQFIDIMKFETSSEEVSSYLKDPKNSSDIVTGFDRFLTTFIVPESCYKQKREISIPPFRVMHFPNGEFNSKILSNLISKNIPVQWSIQSFRVGPDGGGIYYGYNRHAVVIIGVKKTGKKAEFLIRDSGLKEGYSWWVEESIMKAVTSYSSRQLKTQPDTEPFTWIEPI